MTAALTDTLIRAEPASTGPRSARPGAATTSFDEFIDEAVAQADDAPADRERPATAKRRHGNADDDKGRHGAETGLSAHPTATVEHRADKSPRQAGVESGPGPRGRPDFGSPTQHIRLDRPVSATAAGRYDDPLHHAVAHHLGAEKAAVRSGEATSTSPVHAEPAGRPERPATAPSRRPAAAGHPAAAIQTTRPHRGEPTSAEPTSAGRMTADTTAVPTAAVPAGTHPAAASKSAILRPAPAEGPTGTTAERHVAAADPHSALRDGVTARGASYLKATAGTRPAQATGPQVTDAPVIPAHLPAASASTINSTPVSAPAAPTAPVPLAQPDVAAILANLRGGPDGTYQLRAQVHPAELGSVNITATVAGGTLTVLLTGDAQAHHALSQALPQLRAHLADQGFTGVDVGLGSPDQQAGQTGGGSGEHHTQGSDHPLGTDIGQDGSADSQPTRPLRRAAGAIDTML